MRKRDKFNLNNEYFLIRFPILKSQMIINFKIKGNYNSKKNQVSKVLFHILNLQNLSIHLNLSKIINLFEYNVIVTGINDIAN